MDISVVAAELRVLQFMGLISWPLGRREKTGWFPVADHMVMKKVMNVWMTIKHPKDLQELQRNFSIPIIFKCKLKQIHASSYLMSAHWIKLTAHILFICSAGNWTKGLVYSRQVLCYWVISPALLHIFYLNNIFSDGRIIPNFHVRKLRLSR